MLYLAADHRGFQLKEKIRAHLEKTKTAFNDLGALEYVAGDDYADYAKTLAGQVGNHPETNQGIALCGSGAGMSIALNRFRGVLAGTVVNARMAEADRSEDNINVLVLPADFIDEKAALESVDKFLSTKFDKVERRVRRLKKIDGFPGV